MARSDLLLQRQPWLLCTGVGNTLEGTAWKQLEKSGRIDEKGSFLSGLLASLLTPCYPALLLIYYSPT